MRGKGLIGVFAVALVSLVILVLGARWVHFRITHAVTNAVFVEAETFTKVAYRRVGGRIVELYKEEGEKVRRGEPLARVEAKDIEVKLEEVRERIKRLKEEIEVLRITKKRISGKLREKERALLERRGEIKLKIESLKVRIEQLERDKERFWRLYKKGVVPSRRFEEVRTNLLSLKKEEEALRRALSRTEAEIKALRAERLRIKEIERKIKGLLHEVEALKRKEKDLMNMLEETLLRSPIDGYVVKRYVSIGEVVRPGQYIYAVYDPRDLYILVLLEETKLKGVKVGNRVLIEIDAFPDVEFEGVVKEIGRAVASKFALIPRDITAGEFTKVVQRVPIKVEITKGPKDILRVGMGGSVAIERR